MEEKEKLRPGKIQLKTKITIRKFANEEAHKKDNPYEIRKTEGNVGLNEGIGELWDLACGLGSPTNFDNANARTGVGDDGITAEDPTQVGLQAVTNKFWRPMDTGFPSRSAQTTTFQSTYGGAEANFDWEEFTVVNAADDTGKNLIRKISSQGTKTAGQTWELKIEVTMS